MNVLLPASGFQLDLYLANRRWITANQRLHWSSRSRLTRQWREYAAAEAEHAGIPAMTGAYIKAELRFGDKRRRDPANWAPTAKAAVDGLVDAGLFPDDNSTVLIGPDMRMGPVVRRDLRGLFLTIYPHGVTT